MLIDFLTFMFLLLIRQSSYHQLTPLRYLSTLIFIFLAIVATFNVLLSSGSLLILGLIFVGYFCADIVTAIYHWMLDNYTFSSFSVLREQAIEFQAHHKIPTLITKETVLNVIYPATPAGIIVLSISLMSNIYLAAFLTSFTIFAVFSQQIHKLSHMKKTSKLAKLLQKGIILSPREHLSHHAAPFDKHYGIVCGHTNFFLDKLKIFPLLERLIFQLTGIRPND